MTRKFTTFSAFNISILTPRQEDIYHIRDILNSNLSGLKRSEIISKSKLTKARTLRILNLLMRQGTIVKDEVKNIFYLL